MNARLFRNLTLRRSTLLGAGFAVLFLSLLQARSWACVPQPFVAVQPRASGAPGTAITITGRNFGSGIVEVRWNAFDGSILASAQGPEFTASASIPQAPDGLYNIIIFRRDVEGAAGPTISAPFEVTRTGDPSQASRPPSLTPRSSRPSRLHDNLIIIALLAGGALIGIVATLGFRRQGMNRRGRPDASAAAADALQQEEDVDVRGS